MKIENTGRKINIQQLNADFGIANQIEFITGKGGLPCIQINNDQASALISVYAGQVLSFKPVNEAEDLLFVSDNAYFQEGKAIKGGVPICWPWFGAAPEPGNADQAKRPDHGFVRNALWSVLSTTALENGVSKIVLEFVDSEETRLIWPFQFHLSLEIIIGDSLRLELLTRNTGNQVFSITEALHSYFNVGDITQVKALGLEQTEYLDKNENFAKTFQEGAITIATETDHIHTDIQHKLLIDDPVFQRKIEISSSGNNNVVVWNPWAKGAAAMKDLDKHDYKHFICLEIANAATDSVEILPNSEHRMNAHYRIV